ncbi:MAG TPA: polysaccharide deacetylase family protein [Terrimicrobiaceae bacterium]|nr:polysaccharide deacetylase family protein [Terrimicrobiaceae bacterium]
MKRLLTGAGLAAFLLAACQTARTQNEPQVIVVPPDELSRNPSLGPAIAAPSATPMAPPAGDSTPAPGTPSPVYASLPQSPAPSAPSRHSYNSCNVDGPYIAITFDDGPHAQLTPKLLDMLKERNIKATFFVVGQCAAEYPDIMKRMAAEGHEVANHSWSHPALTKLGADGVRKQIENTNNAIMQTAGVKPTLMRPPYGATSATLNKRFAEDYGLKVILWSVDPLDWKNRSAPVVRDRIVKGAHPGAIILAHDIHASTVAAMPDTFDILLSKGYKFVTVSELLAMDRPVQMVKKESPAPSAPAPR